MNGSDIQDLRSRIQALNRELDTLYREGSAAVLPGYRPANIKPIPIAKYRKLIDERNAAEQELAKLLVE